MRIGKFEIKHPVIAFGPAITLFLGVLSNITVMAANHAQMPVLIPGGNCKLIDPEDIFHSCMTAATHLKFLADWIVVPGGIASPGDMLIVAGSILMYPALYFWLGAVLKKDS